MDTIVLEPPLRAWLEQDAEQETRSINDMINEADAQYLRERQQARIVADDWGNEAILGRNVLNRLVMVLDGPKQTLQI